MDFQKIQNFQFFQIPKFSFSAGNIIEYASLGPKNYQIEIETQDGNSTILTKVRGFALRSLEALARLQGNKFVIFVQSLIRGIRQALLIPQFNILRTRKRQLYSTINHKLLRNDVYKQRIAFLTSPFTLPYGWSQSLYNKFIKNEI